MLLKRTNLEERLEKIKAREKETALLLEVYSILQKDNELDDRILDQIGQSKGEVVNPFVFDLLESGRIYHIDQIKKICIDYRLRFLDSTYFKGEIPNEAISKIKEIEKSHDIEMKGYKILAPSRLFRLEDKDDPLLFAPIGNGYYYLIHKWGNDLHPLRKIFAWPFKNIVNLALVVMLMSYLLTLMIPEGLFSKRASATEFWIVFFFMFKSLASVVIYYGFALGKNFNPAIWNSKYFNA